MIQQEFHDQKHDRPRYAGNGGDVGVESSCAQLIGDGNSRFLVVERFLD